MPSRFAAVTNKEISQLIKQAVQAKKVTKFGFEVLIGKALSSVWLELIFVNKTAEKVFCLQMQIKLKSYV